MTEVSPPPVAANILDGFTRFGSTAVITVPAGRTWVGKVIIVGSVLIAAAGAASAGTAGMTTTGTGVIPAAGTYAELNLQGPAAAAAGGAGQAANGSMVFDMVVIAPAGNSVTLTTASFQMTANTFSAIGSLV